MIDLRSINQAQFSKAKDYWTAANITKLLVFLLGSSAVLVAAPLNYVPQIVLLLALASDVLQLKSDATKSSAEALLRTLDICRSFGRDVSAADKRDLLADLPRAVRRRFSLGGQTDVFFSSTASEGPRRAIENLLESAWFTRRQAGVMTGIVLCAIFVFGLLSIICLMVALRESETTNAKEQVARIVTAWLMLIVSFGLIKNAWSYFKMHQRCRKSEVACEHLLQSEVGELDALKQWYEYQIARATCPLLPEWLWTVMKGSLNESWQIEVHTRDHAKDVSESGPQKTSEL